MNHYFYDFGLTANSEIRGIEYDGDIVNVLFRDKTSLDIVWCLIGNPYESDSTFNTDRLINMPASELLVQSAYYKNEMMWGLIFTGTDLLSKTYSNQVGYFMLYTYLDEESLNCNSSFTDFTSTFEDYIVSTYTTTTETGFTYTSLNWA